MPSLIHEDERVAKRQKFDTHQPKQTVQGSRIFVPYRTVGLVSPTRVPFITLPLGKTSFQISTSTGKSIHTYDLRRGLNLVFISRPETPEVITATCVWKQKVLAAWGDSVKRTIGVWTFSRGKKVEELPIPADLRQELQSLTVFGSWIVGCCSSRVEVWKSSNLEHYTTIYSSSENPFTGVMCTMPTLLNKILLGREDGSVDIWNISVGKLVYSLMPGNRNAGAVTALEPATALNLLAIARADGSLVVHDIRVDKEVLKLNINSTRNQVISSISFRSDGLGAGLDGRDDGIMATASIDSGDVQLWDLNDGGRAIGVVRNAHYPANPGDNLTGGGINRVEFLAGQPLMITSGHDNSLKSWIFDEHTQAHIPRQLHARSGHASQITLLNFLPSEADGTDAVGKWLLSSSRDRSLWAWSLRRDGQSTELSQGNVQRKAKKLAVGLDTSLQEAPQVSLDDLKAPEITCMACCLNRDGGMGTNTGGGSVWTNVAKSKQSKPDEPVSGWESVITGHKGDKFARTWFWGRKKAGRWSFETKDETPVKSVTITACGTFALVGSAAGGIDMFNLQSGQHRQRFPSAVTPAQARKLKIQQFESLGSSNSGKFSLGQGKHTKAVTGIMVDSLNQTVFSCGLDGRLKFWDFANGLLRYEIDRSRTGAITAARHHRQSDLIALSFDDLCIRIVDTETRKIIRELWGCVGQITDFAFSSDGKWIVAASLDSVIRVWDLPTGHLIDAVRTKSLCTALALSATGEYLATAHANSIGVDIWTNRALFTNLTTRQIDEDELSTTKLLTASTDQDRTMLSAAYEELQEDDAMEGINVSITDQLAQSMTTLSLVPKSRWQTLLHLDIIASRNKPIEAPKAPEKAPFFLPSLEKSKQADGTVVAQENGLPTVTEKSRIIALQKHGSQTKFTRLLYASNQENEAFIEYLKSLAPASADVELRSLNPEGLQNELILFVRSMTSRLGQRRDYELVQAWMSVFLKVHGEALVGYPEAIGLLQEWKSMQELEIARLGAVASYCGGVVSFLRSSR